MSTADETPFDPIDTFRLRNLKQVRVTRQNPDRKLRLLAAAIAAYLETLPRFEDAKHISDLAEQVAEGKLDLATILSQGGGEVWQRPGDSWAIANVALVDSAQLHQTILKPLVLWGIEREGWSHCLAVVACVVDDPTIPCVIDPVWKSETVLNLAQTIYDERAYDRLPILADALQDAGCENLAFLDHCRHENRHVRGCWVLDAILELA